MTVESTINKSGPYAGAGSPGPFPVDFRFLDQTHLRVIKTSTINIDADLILATDYTVAGVGDPTGSVTLTAPLATGEKLTIIRNVPITQEADYVQNDAFPAQSHEDALDKVTMAVQQLAEENDRALMLPPTVSGISTQLPAPAANNLIGWNAAADGLQNMDPSTIASVVAFGTSRADVFNGNGVATNFVLSNNPGAVANLDVSIGGVTQRPGIDYNWSSGTTLTFTAAPPVGVNNVLARYMQGLPQGVSDSAAAQFIQSGAGALPRTAQDKMRERFGLQDIAICDGVTDVSTAVNARFALGKCTIFIPTNVYGGLTGTILVPQDCAIEGEGKTHGGFIIRADVAGIRITGSDARLKGFGVTRVGSHTKNGIEVGDLTHNARAAIIEDVASTGMGLNGIAVRYGNLGTIRNVKASSNGQDGIYFGTETIDTNAWTIEGTNDLQSNVRDGIHFQQGSSQNDAFASRAHKVLSTDAQTNGRHNIYVGTPSNFIQGYYEAGGTSDIYLDTYAYGNFVMPSNAQVITDVGAGTSFNMIMEANPNANKWRQFAGKTLFAGGTNKGIRISNTDATAGVLDIEKTGTANYVLAARTTGQDQTTTFDHDQYPTFKHNVRTKGAITPDNLFLLDGASFGTFKCRNVSSTGSLSIFKSAANTYYIQTGDSGGGHQVNFDAAAGATNWSFKGSILPASDNAHNLGSGGLRFGTVFAATGAINTSDERSKTDISDIDAAVLRAWSKVEFVQYKFKDAVVSKGDGARWHFGVIAQRVKAAFEAEGLDAFAYGLLCYDEFDAVYEDVFEDVEIVVTPADEAPDGVEVTTTERRPTGEKRMIHEAGNRYGIRYEEALALECAYLRSRLPG